MVVAAPSFMLPLLLALPLAAQQPRLDVRAGVLGSSTLVEDVLATPALKVRFSGLGGSPSARAAPSPEFSVGASLPLRSRARLTALLGWQPTTLRAEDAAGTRDVQDLSLLSGMLEVELAGRGPLVIAGGVGVLGYRSDGEGLFAEGSDLAPLLRVGVGGRWAVAGQSVLVRAVGDVHRFGTPLLRSAGGSGGGVFRYGLQIGVVPGGGR